MPQEVLWRGQSISSCDGRFRLVLQDDSNLVLYHQNLALWASNTLGKNANLLRMQANTGDLVVGDISSKKLWHSNTRNHPGAYLALQDDGNLVVYENSKALWSSNTHGIIPTQAVGCGVINPGHGLIRGESWSSCNGEYTLHLQDDGNLVLYDQRGMPLWSADIKDKGGLALVMEHDGNLVVYGKQRKKIWSSNTSGNPNAYLNLLNDANIAVFSSNDKALWVSNSAQVATPTAADVTTAFNRLSLVRRANSQLDAMLVNFSAFEACRSTMRAQWVAAVRNHDVWVKNFPQQAQQAGLRKLGDTARGPSEYENTLLATMQNCRKAADDARPNAQMMRDLGPNFLPSLTAIYAWLDIEQSTIEEKKEEIAYRASWRQSLIANREVVRCSAVAHATADFISKLSEICQKARSYLDTNHMPKIAQRQARIARGLLGRAMSEPVAQADECPSGGRPQVQATIRALMPVALTIEKTVDCMSEEELWHHYDMRIDAIDANWAAECADTADKVEWFGIDVDSEESFERYLQCAVK